MILLPHNILFNLRKAYSRTLLVPRDFYGKLVKRFTGNKNPGRNIIPKLPSSVPSSPASSRLNNPTVVPQRPRSRSLPDINHSKEKTHMPPTLNPRNYPYTEHKKVEDNIKPFSYHLVETSHTPSNLMRASLGLPSKENAPDLFPNSTLQQDWKNKSSQYKQEHMQSNTAVPSLFNSNNNNLHPSIKSGKGEPYTSSTSPLPLKKNSISIPTSSQNVSTDRENINLKMNNNPCTEVPDSLDLSSPSLIITPPLFNSSTTTPKNSFNDSLVSNKLDINENIDTSKGKAKSVLKNPDGVNYNTNITEHSSVEHFTDEQLIIELQNRAIIKKSKSTAVSIEAQEDGVINVGNKKDTWILSKHVQAYLEKNKKQDNTNVITIPIDEIEPFTIADVNKLSIIVIKESDDNFIKSSQHLLAARDSTGEHYNIFSILTTQTEGLCTKISEEQFKKFQSKLQVKTLTSEKELKSHLKKTQQLRPFSNIQVISKTQVYAAKYDQEYFSSLNEQGKKKIAQMYNDLRAQTYKRYISDIIDKERLFQLCKEIDNEASKQKPQYPLTEDYKKKKKDMKLAQQEQQKKVKEFNKTLYDKKYPKDEKAT